MTLLTLAAKTVRHQARNYAAFFLSSAFSVWLFYLYATLLWHPDFQSGQVLDARQMMLAVEVVVALFSVFFILYSHAAFLKARKKDLALMTLLGMLPRQIARTIALESGIIGLAAITFGAALGTVSAALFFLGIGRILEIPRPIPFHFSWQALLLTYAIYTLLFGVIGLMGQVTVRRLSLAELIRDAARPKAPPRFAWWKVLIAVGSLATGYWLAITFRPTDGETRLLWMMGLILVGTYFLFSQASVAILSRLQRKRGVYWRSTNLFTISQLVYKMRDNARILFMVATLSGIALVTAALFYGAYRSAAEQAARNAPVGLMVVGEPGGLTAGRTEAILQEHGLAVPAQAHLPVLWGQLSKSSTETTLVGLMPESGYRQWTAFTAGQPVTVPPGHALIVTPWAGMLVQQGPELRLRFGETTATFHYDGAVEALLFNGYPGFNWLVVLSDGEFADLSARFGQVWGTTLHGYSLANWQRSGDAVAAVQRAAGVVTPQSAGQQAPIGEVSGTALIFRMLRQSYSYMLFLTGFVCLLFFLASGNMLYFKLFTEIQAERQQYEHLYKLGLGVAEVRRIISAQTLATFFAPLGVAVMNASFFLQSIKEVHAELWKSTVAVSVVYALLYGVYYLVTRHTYVKALLHEG